MRGLKYIILGAAVAAGVGAVAIVRSELERARQSTQILEVAPERVVESVAKTDVLAAAQDLPRGRRLTEDDLVWKAWPTELVSERFITRDAQPEAIEMAIGGFVRAPMVDGEPVIEAKIIRVDHPGMLSAMLRDGMRALAIEIAVESGAGGFILPGDFVDVILTRDEDVETRRADGTYREESVLITQTLLRTVKVLAIDTVYEAGEDAVTEMRRTATIEVTPDMAELIALAGKAGDIVLALRGVSELVDASGALETDPLPEFAVDVRTFAGGSLPGQMPILDGSEPQTVAAPGVAQGATITIVRGATKRRATLR